MRSHLPVPVQGTAKLAFPTQLCRHGLFKGRSHTSIAAEVVWLCGGLYTR